MQQHDALQEKGKRKRKNAAMLAMCKGKERTPSLNLIQIQEVD
jgi:hypothetical protein